MVTELDRVRILLVDDNPDDRRWISRWLEEDQAFACTIAEADCFEDAKRLLESRPFDLGIVDWELPDGAGIELAQLPRVIAQRLPLIFITGAERPDQGSLAVARGAADFLPKDDLTPRALSRSCAHTLTRSRLERELDSLREAERTARVLAEVSLAEERKLRARVTALHALSSMLSAASTMEEIASIVVDHPSAFERSHALAIYLVRAGSLQLHGAVGFEHELPPPGAIPLNLVSPLTAALQRTQSSPLPAAAPGGSCLAIPLISQGHPLGVIDVRYAPDVVPDSDGLAYIELVTQNIAQALHRAHLYDEARLATVFEQRLLAVVGHDLRTPLWAITMVAQSLTPREGDAKLIAQLERSAKRMADLISDVLDRAAMRHGSPAARIPERRELVSVLREQVDELRTALPQADIRLEIVLPVRAQCDASRTAQVVSNLVRNAVQHGEPKSPVLVRLSEHAAAAELTVHNRGAPIPVEDFPDLFDPFKRGRRAGGAGSGLGLFIVHEIVSAIGGDVQVRSDDAGTTFAVSLPTNPPAEPEEHVHPS